MKWMRSRSARPVAQARAGLGSGSTGLSASPRPQEWVRLRKEVLVIKVELAREARGGVEAQGLLRDLRNRVVGEQKILPLERRLTLSRGVGGRVVAKLDTE